MKSNIAQAIEAPQRGAKVWIILNGEPADLYFVEFFSTGVRLAFEADLNEVVFYEHHKSQMFASRADVLLLQCHGLEARMLSTQEELAARRALLAQEVASTAGENAETSLASTVGDLVYQERYSGTTGCDDWRPVSAEEFQHWADEPMTERRVLQVVGHDLANAGQPGR